MFDYERVLVIRRGLKTHAQQRQNRPVDCTGPAGRRRLTRKVPVVVVGRVIGGLIAKPLRHRPFAVVPPGRNIGSQHSRLEVPCIGKLGRKLPLVTYLFPLVDRLPWHLEANPEAPFAAIGACLELVKVDRVQEGTKQGQVACLLASTRSIGCNVDGLLAADVCVGSTTARKHRCRDGGAIPCDHTLELEDALLPWRVVVREVETRVEKGELSRVCLIECRLEAVNLAVVGTGDALVVAPGRGAPAAIRQTAGKHTLRSNTEGGTSSSTVAAHSVLGWHIPTYGEL